MNWIYEMELKKLQNKASTISSELFITITNEGVVKVELSGAVLHRSTNFESIISFIDGMYFAYNKVPIEIAMSNIVDRNDLVIIGNWYYKDHIMDCCDATEEEATAFLDEVDTDNDAVLENANENLQTLFENWKDEREQYCD